jgi:hypothetical protein
MKRTKKKEKQLKRIQQIFNNIDLQKFWQKVDLAIQNDINAYKYAQAKSRSVNRVLI